LKVNIYLKMAEEKLNPINLDDFHNYSKKHLPKMVYDYYVSIHYRNLYKYIFFFFFQNK